MEQFRLVLGLGLVVTQFGVAALMLGLFLKTRGEQASRYWAFGSVGLMLATLVSGFLPLGPPVLWAYYLSAFLIVASFWVVWRGFRSYHERSVPPWGWLVPGVLLLAFGGLSLLGVPQFFRSVSFTLSSCCVLVMIGVEAAAARDSKARWLVVFAVGTNLLSYSARPILMSLGYEVTGGTGSLPGLLATYLVPIVDYFLLFLGLALLAIQKILRQKEALATLDELTRLPNRRALAEAARREVKVSCRSGKPFSLMLVDVDHFKTVNDVSGHVAGDIVLRDVAQALVKACRPTDLVCRYGGDEFVVLCPGMATEQAGFLAQRLNDAVRAAFRTDQPVTASIGLAVFENCDDPVSWELVFERADRALYSAKENGRDRVVVG